MPAVRRTIPDWLKLAGAATEPAEVERCLGQAAALATSCHDWRTILGGVTEMANVSRERTLQIAERTLELARAEHQIWGFRDVATFRATKLGDEAGARDALEACIAVFRTPRTDVLGAAAAIVGREELAHGYEWVLLAQGFLETLRDEQGVRRCLEAGREMARAQKNADDLCSVASEWGKRVDRAEGVALLFEAESLASNGSAQPWTLANAWHALGDSQAVHRVLDGALGRAKRSGDALHVASAWASHHEPAEVTGALAVAQTLAKTAPEWLKIGEVAFDSGLEPQHVRSAVERALALAKSDDARAAVSSAYKQWLQDDAAAARVGPRGLPPEALRERGSGSGSERELPGWESSASDLFDWLRARATTGALQNIANADYGMDADKHLAALRDICATGLVPRTLGWEPHEVLALTRWSEGEQVNHLERALCCALLCIAPSAADELVTNGPILAESCLALGAEARGRAELFFAWRAGTREAGVDADDVSPEEPIALLLLFLLRAAAAAGDPRLGALSVRLVEHPYVQSGAMNGWMADSMRAGLWSDLLEGILGPLQDAHPHVGRLMCALGRA